MEKQAKMVKIGECMVDLESGTCTTHHCKVSLDEPCNGYAELCALGGSLDPYWAEEWHSKYYKAVEQRRLGKKEYRKQYTIPYLGGKVGIAAIICWGITIILGLAEWTSILMPRIPDLEFPALLATFGLPACILTMIALFRDKH